MKVPVLSIVVAALLGAGPSTVRAAQAPAPPVRPSAAALLSAAEAQAGREHKNVFLIFGASWCPWCHRLDALLSAPTLKPFFDKNYVIIRIDGLEAPAQLGLENAGWKDMMATYGVTGQGIPYWLFLGPKGNILASSRSPFDSDSKGLPGNMGFPDFSQPHDLALFLEDVRASAPHYEAFFDTNLRAYLKSLKY